MGCYIHLHVELKINNEWHHYINPTITRWYSLFEKMAGVRGNLEKAISPPKGFPDDASLITKISMDMLSLDAHSISYLDADEIVLLSDWINEQENHRNNYGLKMDMEWDILNCYFFGNSFSGFKKYPEDNPNIQDIRFVFWFDN